MGIAPQTTIYDKHQEVTIIKEIWLYVLVREERSKEMAQVTSCILNWGLRISKNNEWICVIVPCYSLFFQRQ